jgi:4-hydroxybenzoate adenylyltransferase
MSGELRLVDGNLAHTLRLLVDERGWQDRVFLRSLDAAPWTHGMVHSTAARTATVLRELGVQVGDRVAIAMADSPVLAVVYLAALRCGSVPVLMNPTLTAREHAHIIEQAAVRIAACEPELRERFAGCATLSPGEILERSADLAEGEHAVLPDGAEGYIQFTSGTTGLPKGVIHRQADLLVYFAAVGRHQFEMTPDDVILSISKMFFGFGLPCSLLHPALAGASSVLISGRATTEVVAEAIAAHHVTLLLGIPSFFANFISDYEKTVHLSSLRLCISGGEPLLPALAAKIEDALGVPVLNHLGASEVGHGYVGQTVAERIPGTAGTALPPYEIAIRRADGTDAEPGEDGRLWVRGPSLMLGYLNDPESTREVIRGGWLRTGDAGVLDEKGRLTVLGRDDDVQIVSGYKLWPGEVEEVLIGHPLVANVAVVGLTKESGATTLCALVIPVSAVVDAENAEADIRAYAKQHLSPFKVPRSVRFVSSLPLTPTGKVMRRKLRDELEAYLRRPPS